MAQILIGAGLSAATAGLVVNTAISIGLGLVQRALLPDQIVKQEGARLGNSQITVSTEGAPMPRVYGTMRIGGQIIWATTFYEQIETTSESQGGKSGPKMITTTTEYLYSVSFAVGLCEGGDNVTLWNVYADGKLLDMSNYTYRFYSGTDTQLVDPKIEAVEGSGTVPAFRGLAYIVFEDMPLKDFGNRMPQISVEVVKDVVLSLDPLLSDIVTDLCANVGMDASEIDVTELVSEGTRVEGMNIGSVASPRVVLENLMRTFLFDAFETGSVVKFVMRKSPDTVTIDINELVMSDDGRTYEKARVQDTDLPDRTKVGFLDSTRDYNTASVDGHTVTGYSERVDTFDTICALATGYGRALADILTQERWTARNALKFTLPMTYMRVEPGDAFRFAVNGISRQYRIQRVTSGDELEIEAAGFSEVIYDPNDFDEMDGLVHDPVVYGASLVEFYELPLFTQDAPNHWSPRVVTWQTPWPSGVNVYEEDGSGGHTLNTQLPIPAILGVTTTDLAKGPLWVWDNANTVTVDLMDDNANLSSVADLTVLNGANAMAIQTTSGEWEIFQFANAALNGDGTYTLSRLLRGQLGTEYYMGEPTAAGARVMLIDAARISTLEGTVARLGLDMNLRYGPAGTLVGDATYTDETVVPRGVGYRPYAPVSLVQTVSSADLVLTWIRRTRFEGDSWAVVEVPLHEEVEQYEIDILDGVTVVRTIVVDAATTVTYTEAQQIADFGSAQTSVDWVIHQISTTFGRGTPAHG